MSERVYIAASFEQKDDVRKLLEAVEAQGHVITADWTTHKDISKIESAEERQALKQQYAIEDTEGVRSASVYAILLGDRKSTGAHIELGIALGARVGRICLIGSHDDTQLFYSHPEITHFPNEEAFLDALNGRQEDHEV